MPKLAVLFHRLGPYHHARLKALSARLRLTAVEFTTVDNTYAWDIVNGKTDYPVVSLFADADIESKEPSAVVQAVGKALGGIDVDVVAIPGWAEPASLVGLAWCLANRVPAILMTESTAHDEPRRPVKEWVKSRVVRLFSAALVGGKLHGEYAAALGMPRERIFTGYDVVDNAFFQERSDAVRQNASALRKVYGLPDTYFLASNRFIEKKNLPRLVDAYAAYLRWAGGHAWSLVLLGDGPLMPAIRSQVERLGLGEYVYFPGFKQYDELPVYYGLASGFIQASTSEQWGLVVNEAMASALPVLVSERCGCAPDLVSKGINGYTFDPYDVEGLAAQLLRLSSGECDLSRMGKASGELIKANSPQAFAENMLKATEAALAVQPCKANLLDRVLLWLLMRR